MKNLSLHTFRLFGTTLGLLCGMAAIVSEAHAAERVVGSMLLDGQHTVELEVSWPQALNFESYAGTREVLLTFDRGIEPVAMENVVKASQGLIESIDTGYDTLLIRTYFPSRFTVKTKDNRIRVEIEPDENVSAEQRPLTEPEKVRLDVLKTRLLRNTGHPRESKAALESLQEAYPENPQVLYELGESESYFGRWRRADRLFREAHEAAPLNEDIILSIHNVWDEHRPNVKIDYEWEERGEDNVFHKTTLSGFDYIKPYLRLGFEATVNNFETEVLRRADGRVQASDGVRHREELYLQYDYENGDMIKGSLFTGYKALGAGIRFEDLDDYGVTTYLAEYHRTNWDYVEGIADGAVRDRLGLERSFMLGAQWAAKIGAAYNNYSLDGASNVASTISIEPSIRYQLRPRDPLLTIGYLIDAEYRVAEDEKTDPFGVTYLPLPIRSREIHFVDISLYHEFAAHWIAQAFAGYGYDRLGGHGPSVGGSLTKRIGENFEAQIRASHSLSNDVSDDSINRAGAYAMWKF